MHKHEDIARIGENTARRIAEVIHLVEEFDWDQYEFLKQKETLTPEEQGDLEYLETESEGLKSHDEAMDELYSMVLSVEYRSGWKTVPHNFEAEECKLTLFTGGPEIAIFADCNNGFLESPSLRCRDWGTEWKSVTGYREQLDQFITYFYFSNW